MQYFFILGANPTLSIAELANVFGLNKDVEHPMGCSVSNNVFILETNQKINANQLIKKLGGTIKIGKVTANVNRNEEEKILAEAKKLLKPTTGKFKFGISYYGKARFNIKPIAMEIKKSLRRQGVNSRWVTSREPILSSVVVEQNKLTTKGAEIVLIENNKQILTGQTLAVQPFKELSFRDYGRPARDNRSGMLPPKLAQIMINLSSVEMHCVETHRNASLHNAFLRDAVILDPFCGSGTILTEAMLMGYKNLIGSDISPKAINNTKKNIQWIKINYQLQITPQPNKSAAEQVNCKLLNKSAVELLKFIKPKFVDAIITEPYLGPPRGKFNIKKTVQELKSLYAKSLAEFKKILKPNGKIVMIWPIFRVMHNMERITPSLSGFKIINPIPKNLRENKIIKLTDRNTIIYGREKQKIWREIVTLRQ